MARTALICKTSKLVFKHAYYDLTVDSLYNATYHDIVTVPDNHDFTPPITEQDWFWDDPDFVTTAPVPDDAVYLAHLKQKRYDEIDLKTETLIAQGFTYDGHVFSLSSEAQINWTNLYQARALFTYPMDATTKDQDAYSIADVATVEAFYQTGLGTVQYHLDGGRVLKVAVKAATTKAEIDAVVDNR